MTRLEMRPVRERCDVAPTTGAPARSCSFECTFCATLVERPARVTRQ